MGLKNAFPALDDDGQDLVSVPGTPPSLDAEPTGCVFEPRCPFATDECATTDPEPRDLPYRNQRVACHNAERATRMRDEAADASSILSAIRRSPASARSAIRSGASDAVPLGVGVIRSPTSVPWSTSSTVSSLASGSPPDSTTGCPSPN